MVRDNRSHIQRVEQAAQAAIDNQAEAEIKRLESLVEWYEIRRGNAAGTWAFQRLQELKLIKEARNGS